MAEYVFFEGC